MEVLISAFQNPLMQSMIIGPLMGVLFGAVFSGLTQRPTEQVPRTVRETKYVYITRVIERRSQGSESDAGVILVALGLALVFVVWKYAIFESQIHQVLGVILAAIASFSATTIVISFMKGQFTSKDWWGYLLVPVVLQGLCIYLWSFAHGTFDPQLAKIASSVSFLQFYTDALTNYGRYFMLTHVMGVALMCLVLIFSFFSLLYYMALMNQRSGGAMAGLWRHLTKVTSTFSGWGFVTGSAIFVVVSYICIDPSMAASWLAQP